MARMFVYGLSVVVGISAAVLARALPDGVRATGPLTYGPDPRIPLRLLVLALGLTLSLVLAGSVYAKREDGRNSLLEGVFWVEGIAALGFGFAALFSWLNTTFTAKP